MFSSDGTMAHAVGVPRGDRHATNYKCFQAITCNELPLPLRHRAVRKNTHAGLQLIPTAALPSCRQTQPRHFMVDGF